MADIEIGSCWAQEDGAAFFCVLCLRYSFGEVIAQRFFMEKDGN